MSALRSRILRSAPARLVIFFAVLFAVLFAASAATTAIIKHTSVPAGAYFAIFTPLALPMSIGTYVALVRWLERRRATELAASGAARELSLGLLIGAALFSTTIGIIALFGGYSVGGIESVTVLAAPLLMALGSAVTEELLVRGVVFRLLEEWIGSWAALLISAALFGLAHIGNPHATVWSATAIAIEAGTMLAAAYMVTRRLWLPIGIHAAWNYTQGGVFGVAVSGAAMKGLLRGTLRGPAWLSGGEFGAEASAVAVVVCGSVSALFLMRAIRSGSVIAPSWRRRRRDESRAETYEARLPNID